jgi:hypothetical protein
VRRRTRLNNGVSARQRMKHPFRSLLAGSFVALVGCSSQPRVPAVPCQVYAVDGELTRGLVQIERGQERNLLSQLPASSRSVEYCWYQTPKGTLEAQPRFHFYEVGYEFERRDGGWYLLRELQYIDAGHSF